MNHRQRSDETREYGIPSPGYRIPPAARLGRVRLQMAELDRSLEYYRRVLGLRVLERSADQATLAAADAGVPLVELHERRGAEPVPRGGRLGLYHFALLLPDRAALGRLARHLTEIGEHPGASDHLVSEALYLRDPDGLGIEVYADRPRSEWRHRDGQILMATEPLDLSSVARGAGDRSWSGMPTGTAMGHVHLHVGDLDRASAFYHVALGLDKTVWSYPGALFLSAGGYHHHVGLNTWASSALPAGGDDAKLLSWTLVLPEVDDVDLLVESVEEAGHRVAEEGGNLLAEDPWGTAVRLRAASHEEERSG